MENQYMICPLLSIGRDNKAQCAGDLCAWWNRRNEMCSILQITAAIKEAADQIEARL